MSEFDWLHYKFTSWIRMKRMAWNIREAELVMSYLHWRKRHRETLISNIETQFKDMDARLRDLGI